MVSAVKPLLNYITTDILVEKEGGSELTKEMKERIKVDLVIRHSNPGISQLLELASFLDPHFKLGYVSDRESTSKEVKELMCAAGNYQSVLPSVNSEISSRNDQKSQTLVSDHWEKYTRSRFQSSKIHQKFSKMYVAQAQWCSQAGACALATRGHAPPTAGIIGAESAVVDRNRALKVLKGPESSSTDICILRNRVQWDQGSVRDLDIIVKSHTLHTSMP